jgi:hypothetical protein
MVPAACAPTPARVTGRRRMPSRSLSPAGARSRRVVDHSAGFESSILVCSGRNGLRAFYAVDSRLVTPRLACLQPIAAVLVQVS